MKALVFKVTIHRFEQQGEKTGWTYIEVPADICNKLKPGNKKSFRVKGTLDKFAIAQVAVMPMGGGSFILPINAAMRKGTGKGHGAMLQVSLQEDTRPFNLNKDLLACLKDEPEANKFFKTLAPSHQRYFSKWIDEAKTEQTRIRRLTSAVNALARGEGYGEMIRREKGLKD